MKKLFFSLSLLAFVAGLFSACENDDTDFSAYINGTATSVSTIYITYNGTSATVTGTDNAEVTISGAHVTINTGSNADSLLLVLSGSTTDGSLLVYRQRKYGLRLNGVSITNPAGPAINNQCGKSLYVEVAAGTTNSLSDGTAYTEQSYDQKGTLFSEGQIIFSGTGELAVNGNCKHAIACDDYIVFDEATLTAATTTGSGIKVNDGLWINGGTLSISTTATGGRGIRCDSVVVVSGGTTTITTSGGCKIETVDGQPDTTSAACIRCDYPFTMTGGALTMTSSGDGGKGINCSQDIVVSGGTFVAQTTGGNDQGKPKAVKSDTGIIVSGGSFTARVSKSWACDNGYEDDTLSDSELAQKRITIKGTPTTAKIAKKEVNVSF